jgi:ectoine hydroxylase-related dioxygenase (phytanoyl-CoA dioxygenase family)
MNYKEIYRTLYSEGVVFIRSAFDPKDVYLARALIDQVFDKFQTIDPKIAKIHASGLQEDARNILEINYLLKEKSELANTKLFRECQLLAKNIARKPMFFAFDHAIYKQPCAGELAWHQDQAYKSTVKNMTSLIFWLPLQDVGPTEGMMQYKLKSHLFGLLPHQNHKIANSKFASMGQDIQQVPSITFNVKAGDVVVHLPLTLHASLPNQSQITRKAWSVHFCPFGRYEKYLPHNLVHFLLLTLKRYLCT